MKAMYFCPRPRVYLPSLQSAHSQRLAFHNDLPLLTPSKSSSSSSEMHCLILARRTATGQRASGPTLLGKYISMAWMPTLEGLLGISNWVIFAENGLVVWIQEVNRMLFKEYLGGVLVVKWRTINNMARPSTTRAIPTDDYHRSIPTSPKIKTGSGIRAGAHGPKIPTHVISQGLSADMAKM